MASSDDSYADFLDQANQDPNPGKASASSAPSKAPASDRKIPQSLQKIDREYTTESDEPFEPVALKYEGKNLPSSGEWGSGGTLVERKCGY